jgi:putative transposase
VARQLRIQAPGLTYHVTARGVRRTSIYLDDEDRHRFLALLAAVVDRYALRCHAFCQMTNHYHLALTTTDANLSRAVQRLNADYAQWWNWRHERSGHVFQGRFHAQVVQDGPYLANVCRYVVLNPVRAGVVDEPHQWPWSSYRAMIGMTAMPSFLDCGRLHEFLAPGDRSAGPARFREWVLTVGDDEVQGLPSSAIVGDDDFTASFHLRRARVSREVPRQQGRPKLETIFRDAASRTARDLAISIAYRERFAVTEIARYLELHPSTVSKIVLAGSERE